MAVTTPWDVATPAGSADPREGDDRIREIKQAGYERFKQAGMYFDNGSSADADAGKIMPGQQGAANKLYLYESAPIPTPDVMVEFDDSAKTVVIGSGYTDGGGTNDYDLEIQTATIGTLTIGSGGLIADLIKGGTDPLIIDLEHDGIIQGGKSDRPLNATNPVDVTVPDTTTDQVVATSGTMTTSDQGATGAARKYMIFYSMTGGSSAGEPTSVGGVTIKLNRSLAGGAFTLLKVLAANVGFDGRQSGANLGGADTFATMYVDSAVTGADTTTVAYQITVTNLDPEGHDLIIENQSLVAMELFVA